MVLQENSKHLVDGPTDKRTNDAARRQVSGMAGIAQRSILEIAKEGKLRWFGHVTRDPKELDLANTA